MRLYNKIWKFILEGFISLEPDFENTFHTRKQSNKQRAGTIIYQVLLA